MALAGLWRLSHSVALEAGRVLDRGAPGPAIDVLGLALLCQARSLHPPQRASSTCQLLSRSCVPATNYLTELRPFQPLRVLNSLSSPSKASLVLNVAVKHHYSTPPTTLSIWTCRRRVATPHARDSSPSRSSSYPKPLPPFLTAGRKPSPSFRPLNRQGCLAFELWTRPPERGWAEGFLWQR